MHTRTGRITADDRHRKPGSRHRLPTGVLSLCLLIASTSVQAESTASTEYQIKAALTFKLIKFVAWPERALQQAGNQIHLCVYGDDPFGQALDKIAERKVHGLPIALNRNIPDRDAGSCQVIFLNHDSRSKNLQLVEALQHEPILTISDSASFARNGGMIEIGRSGKRLKFTINSGAAKRAGLQIAAPLLELSTIVGEGQ